MTPVLYVFYALFFALALVWPLSFFGYRYYVDCVAAETAKHERNKGAH